METLDGYLAALASEDPVPGGGSAAALVGATGAALVAMVARIGAQNPRYAEHRQLAGEIAHRADELRGELLAARGHDEAAFANVVAAQALPKGTKSEVSARSRALEAALERAAAQPLQAAHLALEVLALAARTLDIPNRNLASDAGCAAEFAYAALAACAYNIRTNHRFMHDAGTIAAQERQLQAYEKEGQAILGTLRSAVARRLARTP